MELEGKITGIQPYGVFVSLNQQQQGLIHISEVKHGYISNVAEYLEIGEKIKVKIIDIDEYSQKISLSLRVYDPPLSSNNHRKKKYFTNKYKQIGFASLEAALPNWIEEAVESLHGSNI